MTVKANPAIDTVRKSPVLDAVPVLYRRRWLILAIFCSYSTCNAFQWNQFASIGDIIARQYGISRTTVDWMSLVYMLTYIVFIFPCNWVLDQKGLLPTAVAGSCLNAIGACIKLIGVGIPSYWLILCGGQTICGIAQAFILSIPARLAGVWFGPKEVSTATAVGVFGNQVGIAIGFLLPPIFVRDDDNNEVVRQGLNNMMYFTAVIAVALFILVIAVFRAAPDTPPSMAQMAMNDQIEGQTYFDEIKKELTNPAFVLLLIGYGIIVGAFYAISTTLNEVMLDYFPGEDVNIGRIGLLIVLAGMVGAIFIGIILDRTHQYRLLTMATYFLTFGLMIAFTFCLTLKKLWLMFVISGLLGFFMTAFLPLGFEYGVEITYPLAEGTSAGLLNLSVQIIGICDILIQERIISNHGVLASNLYISATLLIGCIFIAFVKQDLRRQAAERKIAEVGQGKQPKRF